MHKKLFSFMLALLLIAYCLPVSGMAAGTPQYAVQSQSVTTGDTFTIAVSIADNPGIISMRFTVSYDSSVLELVKVDNAGLLAGYTTPSPTISSPYTLRWSDSLATEDNAAQGTVAILTFKALQHTASTAVTITHTEARNAAGTKVSFAGASAAVAVACNHSYGAWSQIDDTNHSRTCSICQAPENAAHGWQAGTVTKQPSCKETGTQEYNCATCGGTKTVTLDKTETHSYGNWTNVNSNSHKHICSVCSKEESASHSWNAGTVTKAATCKETGMKTYTCTGCSATKTDEIAKTTTHSYSSWTKVDGANHKHSCSVCGKEETASHSWNAGAVTKAATCKEAGVKTYTCTGCGLTKTEEIAKLTTHTYDHACDTDCNVCGQTRTTTHSYNTFWSADKADHWHACSVCGDKKDSAAHTPGVAATESTAQTCTVCGYILAPALGHTHNYAAELTTDENGHWYACSGCNEKKDYADHSFENGCDTLCEACGYTRATSHAYGEDWTSDAQNHWYECAECGEKADEAAHVPGMEATAEAAQTCTVCGYELAPALEVPETAPTSAPATDKQAPEKASFPWWILIAAVVLLGGAAAFIGIKKKK